MEKKKMCLVKTSEYVKSSISMMKAFGMGFYEKEFLKNINMDDEYTRVELLREEDYLVKINDDMFLSMEAEDVILDS
jgi:hypothetical protein